MIVNKIIKLATEEKKIVNIFVDMDGVIAEYKYGEGIDIENNIKNVYLSKRPLYSIINLIKKISEIRNVNLYIVSTCLFNSQVIEKKLWLRQNAPFIIEDNICILISNSTQERKQLKVDLLKKMSDINAITVLIEDSHEILKLAIQHLDVNFMPLHISSLIE